MPLQLCVTPSACKVTIVIHNNHNLHMTREGSAWPAIDPMLLM